MIDARYRTTALFASAAAILIAIAWSRGGEYDEYYSIFLISGHPRPDWPPGPATIASLRHFYHGNASFKQIAQHLRTGDVHPPLYFWLLSVWRRLAGTGLFRLRLLSVLLTLVSLGLLRRIARRVGAPANPTIAITLLSYGFAYTGVVTRNFALADALSLAGVSLLIETSESGASLTPFIGGFVLGAACFTNYLASFTTIAALGWFLILNRRRPVRWMAAGAGAALFLPAGLWFFVAQAASRHGQFRSFGLEHAIFDLARDQAGAILGALPRYATPPWSIVLEVTLGAFALVLIILASKHRLRTLAGPHRSLILAAIVAQPVGLLALGALFDNTPIEVRYFWLGLPYIGIALATVLQAHPKVPAVLLTLQFAAIVGLAIAPETMQPAMRTARIAGDAAGRHTLVVIPFGNDGVGIPGPFVAAAKPGMDVLIARRATGVAAMASAYRRVVVAQIMVDTASRALVPRLDATFKSASCWRRAPAPAQIESFVNHCRINHG